MDISKDKYYHFKAKKELNSLSIKVAGANLTVQFDPESKETSPFEGCKVTIQLLNFAKLANWELQEWTKGKPTNTSKDDTEKVAQLETVVKQKDNLIADLNAKITALTKQVEELTPKETKK